MKSGCGLCCSILATNSQFFWIAVWNGRGCMPAWSYAVAVKSGRGLFYSILAIHSLSSALSLLVSLQVTASTSVLMILFTSSAIALSFYFQGLLNTSYAVVLAPLCFASSLIGASLDPLATPLKCSSSPLHTFQSPVILCISASPYQNW